MVRNEEVGYVRKITESIITYGVIIINLFRSHMITLKELLRFRHICSFPKTKN